MVDNNDKQEIDIKSVPAQEKAPSDVEGAPRFEQAAGEIPERREVPQDDKIVSAELRKEIEMMELDDKTKDEAKKKAEKIEFLGEKEKIEHLLQMAREKGVFFAVQVAKKMNEPYLLDILHDTLAQEGFYRKIMQGNDDKKQ